MSGDHPSLRSSPSFRSVSSVSSSEYFHLWWDSGGIGGLLRYHIADNVTCVNDSVLDHPRVIVVVARSAIGI